MGKKIAKMILSQRETFALNKPQMVLLIGFIAFSDKDFAIERSVSELMALTGLSDRGIQIGLKALEEKRLIFKTKNYCPKKHSTNAYKINLKAFT